MFRCVFDVDGVLLDFESTYIRALTEYFQLEIPDDYEPQSWFFSELLTEEQMKEGWQFFLQSDYFAQMPPLVDPEGFNQLVGAYPVHCVTNIPPECLDRRRENLRNVGFRVDSSHCGGFIEYAGHPRQTKAEVVQELMEPAESLVFIDDHPDNCLNILEYFPDAEIWLMSRPFNREFHDARILRAKTWDDVFINSRLAHS
jgi:phosphoglycolate phosphatase-like HAD superfamily hydrolase